MALFIIILLVIVFCFQIDQHNRYYNESAYHQVTKNSYSSVKEDKGKYAEYLTYESLRHLEDDGGRFLFNAIIPKKYNGSTEIDVILICSKGLFVFECKNFSGWVFGHEAQNKWTQTLPLGAGRCRKEYFYNPIMQNAGHIRHLKNLIGWNVPVHSVVVFSDRCALKNITVVSNNVNVINHESLASVVSEICDRTQIDILSETEIKNIYNKLYPYTQFDDDTKEQHITDAQKFRTNMGTF